MVVLGIDAGGTKTVCQLADAGGRILNEARGPGANLQSAGELEVEKVLHQVIDSSLSHVPAATSPAVICLGMAGVDRPRDAAVVNGILQRIGHRARPLVVNDAHIALEAGAPDGPGLVIISGTGSIAYGRDTRGRAARAGGWGYILGDEGSGYWIGREALRAIVRADDGRGPETSLTARVLAACGAARAQDLVHEIYHTIQPSVIAALAREVEAAAAEHDPIAERILAVGALELSDAAGSVADRLELRDAPIVLAGRALRGLDGYRARVVDRLRERLPSLTPRVLDVEPASGAVRVALAAAHGRLSLPAYLDGSG